MKKYQLSLVAILFLVIALFTGCSSSTSSGGGSTGNGQLSFNSSTISVTQGSSGRLVLTLNESGVESLSVAISSSNPAVAAVSPASCVLTTQSAAYRKSCEIIVTGVTTGSANIIATATGYTVTPVAATVIATPVTGTLTFSDAAVSVSPDTSTQVILSLNNSSGVNGLVVNLTSGNTSIATESPASCTLSSGALAVSSCVVTVSGVAAGSTTITASAGGYTITPLNVTVAAAESYSRTFTIQNNTKSTIWLGSTGGATTSLIGGVSSGSTACGSSLPGSVCPSGSECLAAGVAGNICYFKPLKAAGNNFQIAAGASGIVGVPSTSYDPANDQVWSGNMFARQQCDVNGNNCVIADCESDKSTNKTCTTGANPPVTLVEITMLKSNPDSYDLSLENGITVAASFGPNNAT